MVPRTTGFLVVLFSLVVVLCAAEDYLIETIAGSSLATNTFLNYPSYIAISSSNETYFADTLNHRILKVSTSGIITTIAGTGAASFSGDGGYATSATLNNPIGIAISSANEIYIADTSPVYCSNVCTECHNSTLNASNSSEGECHDPTILWKCSYRELTFLDWETFQTYASSRILHW